MGFSIASPPTGPALPRPHLLLPPDAGRPAAWVLTAGPGSGKTTAARLIAGPDAFWLAGGPTPLSALALALGLDADAAPAAIARHLHDTRPGALVFDDLDAGLADEPSRALLAAALELAGPDRPVILAGRTPPPVTSALALARRAAATLGPEALWLSPEEAATWLDGADDPTEGWPLGVELRRRGALDASLWPALVDEALIAPLSDASREAAEGLALLPAVAEHDAPPALVAEWRRWGLLRPDGAWRSLARRALADRWASRLDAAAQRAERTALADRLAPRDPDAALSVLLDGRLADEAIALLRRLLKDFQRAGAWDRLAELLERLPADERERHPDALLVEGALRQARGDYPGAEARFRRAASAFEAAGARSRAFEAYGDLMHLYWTKQDHAAFAEAAASASAFEADATPAERVEYLNNLACSRFGAGDADEAGRLFRQVLDYPHFEDVHVASVQQFASINMGVIEKEAGDFDAAERHLTRVLALAEAFTLRPSVQRGARLYLATVALQRGDRAGAEAHFQALAANPIPAEEKYRRAEFLQKEGDYCLALGDWPGAEARYRQSLATFAELGMDEGADAGAVTNMLGVLHRRRGEPEAAVRQHARALGMVGDWPRYEAIVRYEWGVTLMGLGDDAGAQAMLEAALAALSRARAGHVEASVRLALAVLAGRRGLKAAAEPLERAISAVRAGPYYFQALGGRELAPAWWALLADAGRTDMLEAIEARFPAQAADVRQALAERAPTTALPPQAPEAIAIRLFGAVEVAMPTRPEAAWPRKKAKALLGLLALRPAGYGREELAETLFPDLGGDEAAHQLDNLVSTLRKVLEPTLERRQKSRHLIIKDRHYRFERADARLDVDEFETAYLDGRRAWHAGDAEAGAEAYERAVALYRGDLLAEPMLLEWFDLERHGARQRALEMLDALADHHAAGDRFERARAHSERQLAIDPADERAHRRLMRLYARLDQPALAQRQLETCRRALAQLVDAEPSAETLALARAIARPSAASV